MAAYLRPSLPSPQVAPSSPPGPETHTNISFPCFPLVIVFGFFFLSSAFSGI